MVVMGCSAGNSKVQGQDLRPGWCASMVYDLMLMPGGSLRLTCDTRSVTCAAVAPGAVRAVLTKPLACSSSSLTAAAASASLRALTCVNLRVVNKRGPTLSVLSNSTSVPFQFSFSSEGI